MAIRPILRMGHPLLLERAQPLPPDWGRDQLQRLVTDLCDTMEHMQGAGLAAPQIGVGVRVVVFGFQGTPRYPEAEAIPYTVLINPLLTPLGGEQESGWEGCLSVPGLRGWVPRYTHLRYQGLTLEGDAIDRTVAGFHARVVQHECDHLNGILYPMRITDFTRFGFQEELLSHFPAQLPPGVE